jgi:hypothetical protein
MAHSLPHHQPTAAAACGVTVAGSVDPYTFLVTSGDRPRPPPSQSWCRPVAEAAAAFLDTCTAPSTRRSYTQTMTRLIAGHGTAPVTALDGETLRELLTTSWDNVRNDLP